MRRLRWLAVLLLALIACQPATPASIMIIDGEKHLSVPASSDIPSELFVRAGIILGPHDAVLHNGAQAELDQPLPESSHSILQLRRAVTITIQTPDGAQVLQTAAWTVGQALNEAGIALFAADRIEPPASTPISGPMAILYSPARVLTIHARGAATQVRSSAMTVGEALTEAGMPLMGLDTSQPAADQPVPADGQIRLIRVNEKLVLIQKPIAFENEYVASADVPLDQQQVLNPGRTGLSMSRVRIRFEDGQEVARQTESETIVQRPENRVVAYGTKVEVKTAVVDGVKIEYWRAAQMFATAYSPCRSAPDRCYSSTASGKPVKKGVVALRTDLYMALRGQALYIPGYGYATVEDACGGCTGKPWIDLGYSDADYQTWGTWVTVYFLTPVPANPSIPLE